MYLSYLTPNKLTYTSGILAVAATTLLGCSRSHMTAMVEDEHLGQASDLNNQITILESVPSQENGWQEAKQELPVDIVIVDAASRSRISAYPDSISPSELASIEKRIGIDETASVLQDIEKTNSFVATQKMRESAAVKIQSVARMYNNSKLLRAKSSTTQTVRNLPNLDREKRLDWIKLSAVGASAFALGGYMQPTPFHKQTETQATGHFHDHTDTINNRASSHFGNASRLCHVHPIQGALGVGTFLVGGYVARKVSRSLRTLREKLREKLNEVTQLNEALDNKKRLRGILEQKCEILEDIKKCYDSGIEKLSADKDSQIDTLKQLLKNGNKAANQEILGLERKLQKAVENLRKKDNELKEERKNFRKKLDKVGGIAAKYGELKASLCVIAITNKNLKAEITAIVDRINANTEESANTQGNANVQGNINAKESANAKENE